MEAVYQLVIVELWSLLVDYKPPCGGADRRAADVAADRHIAEEQPTTDKRFFGVARRLVHDIQIWWIEAKRRGRQAVRHQVDPEQLDGDERLRHSQCCRQEYTDHLRSIAMARKS